MRIPPQDVERKGLSAKRLGQIRKLRAGWRLNDSPRFVTSKKMDAAMWAVEQLLEEVDRLRGSNGP